MVTLDQLRQGHMAYEAYVQNRDKGENIKSLEKWNDKLEFDDWDRKVTETLSLVYGRNYCPIAYVIRPDKPAGWDPEVDAVNNYKRLMYQLPLNGVAYNHDNKTVFSFIGTLPGQDLDLRPCPRTGWPWGDASPPQSLRR